jgi:hypothetical protein
MKVAESANSLAGQQWLHIYTGENDKDLAASLGLAVGTTGPSIAIERYLESDCTLKVFK